MTAAVLIAVLMLVVIVYAFADSGRRDVDDDEPPPCSALDPRCVALADRLAEARARMDVLGIAPLMGKVPRQAWPRASGTTVVQLRAKA